MLCKTYQINVKKQQSPKKNAITLSTTKEDFYISYLFSEILINLILLKKIRTKLDTVYQYTGS